ncbi:nucleotide sugar dehydrogenase [Desulfocurvibacter africanus]|uniref:Nucleotide sugar dehydrogenase n=1 Tax=Desulfocurvibacter africanus subsp. africanus str. Walvis Bay TaxID=690850 RepID=F3YWI5_DESAF|nr:nucleotide sugar dehydrogenase [Desulfocurvibacter africanus]EGJ49371.1 nucleotide sugar dehydrogenase [Desulfocurvibacter africanus subsp. africanus str. Walvis Bay]
MKAQLLQKLQDKSSRIGIVGLGYVGLPLAKLYLQNGFPVYGFDIDEKKITALKEGRSYIEHVDAKQFQSASAQGKFVATTDYSRASEVDALILCVPTPLNEHREPDLSFVINSLLSVLPHLKAGQVLSLESTTYPGTTNEELRPRIEERGFTIGQDFFLVFSPEREDPNNPKYSTNTIPKVCGGETEACLEVGMALYRGVIETIVPVSSTQAAEMTKILENTFRAVNIALVNELKIVAERMGLDIFEVIRAAATKPFGFMPFFPGPGLGGHCIPIDPFYLTWKAREYGVATRFIELAGEVNTAMPDYVIGKIMAALNEHGKAVNGSRILVLGAAYKKNVDDTRESSGLALIAKLQGLGAQVDYSDPHVPVMPEVRKYSFDMRSVPLTSKTLAEYDLVLVATDHDRFDWKLIEENARVIVDTRGRYRQKAGKVYRA